MIACSWSLNKVIDVVGTVMLALSLGFAVAVYRNSLKVVAGPGLTRRNGNAARVLYLILIEALLSFAMFARIHYMLGGDTPALERATWVGRVVRVVQKRYCQEAEMLFRAGIGDSDADRGAAAWYNGVARVTDGTISQGDVIRFTGKPFPVRAGFGSPSLRRSLLLRGIRYVFYLDGAAVSTVALAASRKTRVRTWLADNSDRLFNRETSPVVKALYFGNQDFIDKITLNDFKRAGVLHVLSASGLHVGVVAAIPLFLLGLLRLNRKLILVSAALVVFFYLYITDMPVSLFRACVMFFLYTVQRLMDREVNIFNTLFLAAVIILLVSPGEMFSLGCQLSFGATLGILLFHEDYRKCTEWLPALLGNPLALTLSAQALVIPIIMARMNEVNLAGFASNIIVVPLMSLLLIVSLAAHATSYCGAVAALIGRGADVIYGFCNGIVQPLSGLDCHYYTDHAGPSLVAAFCLLLLPLLPRLRGKRIMSLSILAAIAVAWLAMEVHSTVKRDDIIAIRHRQGTLLLVKDGDVLSVIGELPEKPQIELVQHEIAFRVCREVNLHIPHPDYRNIAGYTYLLKRLPVRRCYLSVNFNVRKYTRRFFDILERDTVELIIHDCGPGAISGFSADRGDFPEQVCGLYERVSAGTDPLWIGRVF